jgi:thioredoxin 1
MNQHAPIPQVDVSEAAERLQRTGDGHSASAGPLLVDVRETGEIAAVHVPGSLHAPMSDFANAAQQIPSGRPLLLICASGRRSLAAADYLRRNGHPDVANVAGGIIEWQKRGLPTDSGPLPPHR